MFQAAASKRGDLMADREAAGHFGLPLGRAEQLPPRPEVRRDPAEGRQERCSLGGDDVAELRDHDHVRTPVGDAAGGIGVSQGCVLALRSSLLP